MGICNLNNFRIPTICVYLDLCPPRRGNYRNRSQKLTNYLCCLPGSHESNSSTGSCLRIIAPQTISRLIDLEFLKLFGWLIELNRFYCYSNKQKQASSKFAKIISFLFSSVFDSQVSKMAVWMDLRSSRVFNFALCRTLCAIQICEHEDNFQ